MQLYSQKYSDEKDGTEPPVKENKRGGLNHSSSIRTSARNDIWAHRARGI